jgi:hypothetical protein
MGKRVLVALALAGAFLLAMSNLANARTALVRSGLLDDFGIFTRPVEDGLKAQGYKVTRIPWWKADSGKYTVAAGHSKGADAVLRDNAKTIIAIDPTLANSGCPKGRDCTAYVGHANKFPFLICCGGYEVRGAKNIAIAPGHVQAPRIALKQILKQTARLK